METQPETGDTTKSNITILVNVDGNEVTVGAIQTLSITERADSISGTAYRVRLDRLRLGETFSRGFLHAKAQMYPLHILIESSKSELKTKICNVWIKMSETYETAEWVIVDEMSFVAENIEVVAENQ